MRHTLELKDIPATTLMYDKTYYLDIFKKTEKVVTAVFFIIKDTTKGDAPKDTLLDKIADTGCDVLDAASKSLLENAGTSERTLLSLMAMLTHFDGLLRVSVAAQLVPNAYADLISGEIAIILKNIDRHREQTARPMESEEGRVPYARTPRKAVKQHEGERREVKAEHGDRRMQIREFLKANGQANIKDIATSVPGVSEKSIQRDLKRMVLEGEIEKKGERRWSIYSLTPSNVPDMG